MTHEKRRLYKIKELKRQGLSYEERGEKIREFKQPSKENKKFIEKILAEKVAKKIDKIITKKLKQSLWTRIKKFVSLLLKNMRGEKISVHQESEQNGSATIGMTPKFINKEKKQTS